MMFHPPRTKRCSTCRGSGQVWSQSWSFNQCRCCNPCCCNHGWWSTCWTCGGSGRVADWSWYPQPCPRPPFRWTGGMGDAVMDSRIARST